MITFDDARAIVEAQHGPTLPTGAESTDCFLVIVAAPTDDLVSLVDKNTGQLDREPYGQVASSLVAMTPCPAPEPVVVTDTSTDPSKEEDSAQA